MNLQTELDYKIQRTSQEFYQWSGRHDNDNLATALHWHSVGLIIDQIIIISSSNGSSSSISIIIIVIIECGVSDSLSLIGWLY